MTDIYVCHAYTGISWKIYSNYLKSHDNQQKNAINLTNIWIFQKIPLKLHIIYYTTLHHSKIDYTNFLKSIKLR